MKKTLKIEGMSCEHCVKAVNGALSAIEGVNAVKVDLDSKSAEVEVGGAVTDDMLRTAVEEEDYEVVEIV